MSAERALYTKAAVATTAGILLLLLLLLGAACGAAHDPAVEATSRAAPPAADAGHASDGASRPFAATAVEAQILIQEQIEKQAARLWKCVETYRAAHGDLHRSVVVDIGIDQEGRLLGVTAASTKQGNLDAALKGCLSDGLVGLPFPRSHSGIITVRQSFTDAAVTP